MEEDINFIRKYIHDYFYEDIVIEDDLKFEKSIEHLLQEYKDLVAKSKEQNEKNKRQQAENKKMNEKILNQKGQLKSLNIARKEDEAVIKEMVDYIGSNNYVDIEECQFREQLNLKKCEDKCKNCIENYFRKKVSIIQLKN